MDVKIKKMTETAKVPTRGSEYAAGFDLYADLLADVVIDPHQSLRIPTGIAMEIPNGMFGGIYARSGLASKNGLRPANCVGVVDSDYRGEIIVVIHNDTDSPQKVEPEDRIAQLIIQPYVKVTLTENVLSETDRGDGGFGSTGR